MDLLPRVSRHRRPRRPSRSRPTDHALRQHRSLQRSTRPRRNPHQRNTTLPAAAPERPLHEFHTTCACASAHSRMLNVVTNSVCLARDGSGVRRRCDASMRGILNFGNRLPLPQNWSKSPHRIRATMHRQNAGSMLASRWWYGRASRRRLRVMRSSLLTRRDRVQLPNGQWFSSSWSSHRARGASRSLADGTPADEHEASGLLPRRTAARLKLGVRQPEVTPCEARPVRFHWRTADPSSGSRVHAGADTPHSRSRTLS